MKPPRVSPYARSGFFHALKISGNNSSAAVFRTLSYFRIVENCAGVAMPRSCLLIDCWQMPTRTASCNCVNPDFLRANLKPIRAAMSHIPPVVRIMFCASHSSKSSMRYLIIAFVALSPILMYLLPLPSYRSFASCDFDMPVYSAASFGDRYFLMFKMSTPFKIIVLVYVFRKFIISRKW